MLYESKTNKFLGNSTNPPLSKSSDSWGGSNISINGSQLRIHGKSARNPVTNEVIEIQNGDILDNGTDKRFNNNYSLVSDGDEIAYITNYDVKEFVTTGSSSGLEIVVEAKIGRHGFLGYNVGDNTLQCPKDISITRYGEEIAYINLDQFISTPEQFQATGRHYTYNGTYTFVQNAFGTNLNSDNEFYGSSNAGSSSGGMNTELLLTGQFYKDAEIDVNLIPNQVVVTVSSDKITVNFKWTCDFIHILNIGNAQRIPLVNENIKKEIKASILYGLSGIDRVGMYPLYMRENIEWMYYKPLYGYRFNESTGQYKYSYRKSACIVNLYVLDAEQNVITATTVPVDGTRPYGSFHKYGDPKDNSGTYIQSLIQFIVCGKWDSTPAKIIAVRDLIAKSGIQYDNYDYLDGDFDLLIEDDEKVSVHEGGQVSDAPEIPDEKWILNNELIAKHGKLKDKLAYHGWPINSTFGQVRKITNVYVLSMGYVKGTLSIIFSFAEPLAMYSWKVDGIQTTSGNSTPIVVTNPVTGEIEIVPSHNNVDKYIFTKYLDISSEISMVYSTALISYDFGSNCTYSRISNLSYDSDDLKDIVRTNGLFRKSPSNKEYFIPIGVSMLELLSRDAYRITIGDGFFTCFYKINMLSGEYIEPDDMPNSVRLDYISAGHDIKDLSSFIFSSLQPLSNISLNAINLEDGSSNSASILNYMRAYTFIHSSNILEWRKNTYDYIPQTIPYSKDAVCVSLSKDYKEAIIGNVSMPAMVVMYSSIFRIINGCNHDVVFRYNGTHALDTDFVRIFINGKTFDFNLRDSIYSLENELKDSVPSIYCVSADNQLRLTDTAVIVRKADVTAMYDYCQSITFGDSFVNRGPNRNKGLTSYGGVFYVKYKRTPQAQEENLLIGDLTNNIVKPQIFNPVRANNNYFEEVTLEQVQKKLDYVHNQSPTTNPPGLYRDVLMNQGCKFVIKNSESNLRLAMPYIVCKNPGISPIRDFYAYNYVLLNRLNKDVVRWIPFKYIVSSIFVDEENGKLLISTSPSIFRKEHMTKVFDSGSRAIDLYMRDLHEYNSNPGFWETAGVYEDMTQQRINEIRDTAILDILDYCMVHSFSTGTSGRGSLMLVRGGGIQHGEANKLSRDFIWPENREDLGISLGALDT